MLMCAAAWHIERLRGESEGKGAACAPLSPSSLPTFALPPHLSSFCLLHLSLNSLLRALHLAVCLPVFPLLSREMLMLS